MNLVGKVALVTGGSRGIGRAIAVRLAKEGVDIALCARNTKTAESVALEVEALGRKCLVLRADVSDSEQANTLIETVLNDLGSLYALVNNAGITRDNLLLRMKDDEWDSVIETNLKGVFNCSRAAARTLIKARSGRIINISSVVGIQGNAGQVNYASSKAGMIGLTKSLARELASRSVTVNAVAPGLVPDTGMTDELTAEVMESMLSKVPLGRPGKPEDVANTVAFLASSEAEYITGQVISVDGGMAM